MLGMPVSFGVGDEMRWAGLALCVVKLNWRDWKDRSAPPWRPWTPSGVCSLLRGKAKADRVHSNECGAMRCDWMTLMKCLSSNRILHFSLKALCLAGLCVSVCACMCGFVCECASKLELKCFDAEDTECRSFIMTLCGCQQCYQCLWANQ